MQPAPNAVGASGAANVSITVTACASDGPAFTTVIAYVAAAPGTNGDGVTVLVIDTFADGAVGVTIAVVLSEGSGSAVEDVTVTAFVADVWKYAASTKTVTVNVAVAPPANVACVHVTV